MFQFRNILAISPHTDDVELSCGGTIAELIAQGSRVHYVALSDCRDTLINTAFSPDTLQKECESAVKILGIQKKDISIFHHTNKCYIEKPRDIFATLEKLRDSIQPDLILIPDVQQTHQDHKTVAEQA